MTFEIRRTGFPATYFRHYIILMAVEPLLAHELYMHLMLAP